MGKPALSNDTAPATSPPLLQRQKREDQFTPGAHLAAVAFDEVLLGEFVEVALEGFGGFGGVGFGEAGG